MVLKILYVVLNTMCRYINIIPCGINNQVIFWFFYNFRILIDKFLTIFLSKKFFEHLLCIILDFYAGGIEFLFCFIYNLTYIEMMQNIGKQ